MNYLLPQAASASTHKVVAGSNSKTSVLHPHFLPVDRLPSLPPQQEKVFYRNNNIMMNQSNNNSNLPLFSQNQDRLLRLQHLPTSFNTVSPTRSPSNASSINQLNEAAATSLPPAAGVAPRLPPTVSSIIQQILDPPQTSTSLPRYLSFNYTQRLETSALQTISKLWADSTIDNRRHLWKRFLEFTNKYKLPIQQADWMDWSIVIFLEHAARANKHLLPSSLLTYSKTLAAIASRLSMPVPRTRMYQAGLRASGALIPQEQAPPLPFRPHLARLIGASLQYAPPRGAAQNQRMIPKRLFTLLFLMVKTCSRFDEVQRLERQQVVILDNPAGPDTVELFIDWKDRTKSSRSDPNREDMKIILRHDPGIPQEVLEVLDKWEWTTLLPYNVDWFNRWMDHALGDLQGKNALNEELTNSQRQKTNYSAHSVKACVVTHLTRCFQDGKLLGNQVSLLAKHSLNEASRMEGITRQTLRYVRDPVLVARLNGTMEATQLIPWPTPAPPPTPSA